jgi:hypothetical protein
MTASEHASDIDFIRAKIQELMEDLGPEAVTELAQSFVDETPDTLHKLQNYTISNDFQKLRRAATPSNPSLKYTVSKRSEISLAELSKHLRTSRFPKSRHSYRRWKSLTYRESSIYSST